MTILLKRSSLSSSDPMIRAHTIRLSSVCQSSILSDIGVITQSVAAAFAL